MCVYSVYYVLVWTITVFGGSLTYMYIFLQALRRLFARPSAPWLASYLEVLAIHWASQLRMLCWKHSSFLLPFHFFCLSLLPSFSSFIISSPSYLSLLLFLPPSYLPSSSLLPPTSPSFLLLFLHHLFPLLPLPHSPSLSPTSALLPGPPSTQRGTVVFIETC